MFHNCNSASVNIDLETNGLSADAPITAAAIAVALPSNSILLWTSPISLMGQSHRVADPETLAWWQEQKLQNPRLCAIMHAPFVHLHAIYSRLRTLAQIPNVTLWAHGTLFDIPILKSAAHIAAMPWPFAGKCTLDGRTALEFFPAANLPTPSNWIPHSAGHDVVLDTIRLLAINHSSLAERFYSAISTTEWQDEFLAYTTKEMYAGQELPSGELLLYPTGQISRVRISWPAWARLLRQHAPAFHIDSPIPLIVEK